MSWLERDVSKSTPPFTFTHPFPGHWDDFLATETTFWMLHFLTSQCECILTKTKKHKQKNTLTTHKMFSDFIRREETSLSIICLPHTLQHPDSTHRHKHTEIPLVFLSRESTSVSLKAALYNCSPGGFLTGTFRYFSHGKIALTLQKKQDVMGL